MSREVATTSASVEYPQQVGGEDLVPLDVLIRETGDAIAGGRPPRCVVHRHHPDPSPRAVAVQ